MSEIVSILKEEILSVINLFDNFKFPPEQLLISYIAILGILATIITLGSSLTKEWRQDLIIKYLIKKKFVVFYAGYLLISFILFTLIYSVNIKFLENISFFLFIASFIWTFVFLYQFIRSLDRKRLYQDIYSKFREDLKNAEKE
ncbi:MAG: hypothetical protein WCX73_05180 [Candidatus Pacearchaeota archaeon]|jgi:hypothetical protein